MKDWEQLYYDELYKNKKLENEIKALKEEIQEINLCRTKRNVDLQEYIMQQFKKYKKV